MIQLPSPALDWLVAMKKTFENRSADMPGVSFRPDRRQTRAIIIHAIGDGPAGLVGDTFGDIERFFLDDPEGVATVTLPGTWLQKAARFSKWWDRTASPGIKFTAAGFPERSKRHRAATRIPLERKERAFVPYTFGICGPKVVQWLPWDARGAHARGWNHKSVSIALVRDVHHAGPLQREEAVALANVLTYCHLRVAGLTTHTHDEANRLRSLLPKGCPGVDVSQTVRWATRRAAIMRMPRAGR